MISERLKIFAVAGEASGDILGAQALQAVNNTLGAENVTLRGVGGENMQACGLNSLYPITDLSVMGLAEILPALPRLLGRLDETTRAVERFAPDILLTIDSPDFNFRLVPKIRKRMGRQAPRCVHIVAPSVWAWRPGRAAHIAEFLDQLLCLLPIEPPYFEAEGLPSACIGHPAARNVASDPGAGSAFRQRHGLPETGRILGLLPGSRRSEVSKLIKPFAGAARRLIDEGSFAAFVTPTWPHLRPELEPWLKDLPGLILEDMTQKPDAFAAMDGAIAASGTVTLELAAARVPHCIGYKVAPLTALIGRAMLKTPFVNLINILAKKPVVPELLQEQCRSDKLYAAIHDAVLSPDQQHQTFDQVMPTLSPPNETEMAQLIINRKAVI